MAYQGKFAPGPETHESKSAPVKVPAKKKKRYKGNRNVTLTFYTLYFLAIFALIVGIFCLNNRLETWLAEYEQSQPDIGCEEVFQEYFADPDWVEIYALAGLRDTTYENAESFAAHMTQTVTGPITYSETSAGLSGGRRYLLKDSSRSLGYFTLTDQAAGTGFAQWQLDELVIYVSYHKTFLIQTLEDHKVTINGVPLEQTQVVRVTDYNVKDYLPEGTEVSDIWVYQVDGLMTEPDITVTDPEGNTFEVVYDDASGMYIQQTDYHTPSETERETILGAAESYAAFMVGKAGRGDLQKYFDANRQLFWQLNASPKWMDAPESMEISGQEISDFCRYSDTLFSARVSLQLNCTGQDSSVQQLPVEYTLFFQYLGSRWLVYDLTEEETFEEKVRLRFISGETEVFTNLYEIHSPWVLAPVLTAPEGKVFAGWYREDVAENGNVTYTLVFSPDEDGNIYLTEGSELEPVTICALFEDATNITGGN